MKISNLALVSMLTLCSVGTGIFSSLAVSRWVPAPASAPAVTVARANTSDRVDGYLTCTGYVDVGIEAVYILDSTTGVLSAGVLSKNSNSAGFQARFQGNVYTDLERAIKYMNSGTAGKKTKSSRTSSSKSRKNEENQQIAMMLPSEPKYIMTAGMHDIPGTNSIRPGLSALYVTEVNTGLTLVYILPWNPSAHSGNVPMSRPITYYTIDRFLIPMVTEDSVEGE